MLPHLYPGEEYSTKCTLHTFSLRSFFAVPQLIGFPFFIILIKTTISRNVLLHLMLNFYKFN